MNHRVSILLKGLHKSPYADIVCYPRLTRDELCNRLKELEQLRITAIEFTGEKIVHSTPILGKGCVGLVVKAFLGVKPVALKIRRTDADRKEMVHEAEMLKMANSVNVGPGFFGLSRDFIVMEYLQGLLFPEWLMKTMSKRSVRCVLRLALEQCWQLDMIGLDHGELSHAPKHIIVRNDKPCIIDFETASMNRKAQNVTSLSQYFFISNQTAKHITKKLGAIDQERLKLALRNYKKKMMRENFETVLRTAGLVW